MTAFALNNALKAALMLMAGSLAVRCLRSRPAALRHLVWTLVLAAALALPLLDVALAGHRIELPVFAIGERPMAEMEIGAAPGGEATERGRVLFFLTLPDPSSETSLASRALLAVWLMGSLILLARMAWGRTRLRRIVRGSRPVTGEGVQELLAEAAGSIGCRRRVRLLVNGRVPTPVTFGILRPVVVLPPEWEAWPAPRTRAVLLHELGHVARLDAVPQLLAETVRAIHWFDPFAWHAARRLAAERERACDDAVLSVGVCPREYAAKIVEMAREMSARPGLAGMLPIVPRSDLESRLVAILDASVPRQRITRLQRLRLLGAAGCCAGLLASLAVVPAARAEEGYSLDDPRSEIVPVGPVSARPAGEVRGAAERAAVQRLRAAAAHVKTWEGDLVRERAEWALSQVRDGEVVAPLLRALGDSDWRVQAYAAWALAVAGDARAARPLTSLLGHPVWRVRAQAVYSLLDLDAGLPPARLGLLAADPAWQVRIGVVEHLARRGGPEAAARLRTLADDPHTGTRLAARNALSELETATR